MAVLLIVCGIAVGQARAEDRITTITNPRELIKQDSKVTYKDLLIKIFPDVADDTKTGQLVARRTIPITHLDGNYKQRVLRGYFKIESFRSAWIKSNGLAKLLLQIEINPDNNFHGSPWGNEATLLASFNLGEEIKLEDIVDIKSDQNTGFWSATPLFKLDIRNDAVVVCSNHSSSQQNYDDVTVLLLDNGKFKKILGVVVFTNHACGADFEETLTLTPLPDRARQYPKLAAKVRVTKRTDRGDCDKRTPAFTRYYQDVFFWDSATRKYSTLTNQLDALSKFNEKYY